MARSILTGAALVVLAGSIGGPQPRAADDGRDERITPTNRPTVEAAFVHESYAPGVEATLTVFSRARDVSLSIFRAGTSTARRSRRDVLPGTPVAGAWNLGEVGPGVEVSVPIGDWPSGLYFARLTGAGGKVGYAPFVLRPRRLGSHSTAVVLATQTWQAYNFRDDDRDGRPDTWYAGAAAARLARPYENRGVPPHYNHYDEGFLDWLAVTHREVDYLSDEDLRRAPSLAAYVLVVFPGHHEYVTAHEYDVVTRFRDGGGNLAFLSANNFYWRIRIHGAVMTRSGRWRELGRPEAALVGVQYFGSDRGKDRRPWIVRDTADAPWLFAGTGLRRGSPFARGGVEADATAAASPRSTKVLAEIPDLFRFGHAAQMTYYETAAGAKVFAAGAFTLADAGLRPETRTMMENLWAHMTAP